MSRVLRLMNNWNYWFCKGVASKDQSYQQCNVKIEYDISTVQDFWTFFIELPKPSALNDQENKQGFTLCRAGVRPEWEDPELKAGGTWTFVMEKEKKTCDVMWRYLLMAAIGQQFKTDEIDHDEIVAVSNEIHKDKSGGTSIRIKVLHKDAAKRDAVIAKIKDLLGPVSELKDFHFEPSNHFHKSHKKD